MSLIKYLLPLLLLSCTLEEVEPETIPEEVVTVIDEPIQQAILQGVYKRSIGSQFEVYEITDKLTVYIETDGIQKQIFQADYTYSDTDIIINGVCYPYILEVDKITICGYTYYKE